MSKKTVGNNGKVGRPRVKKLKAGDPRPISIRFSKDEYEKLERISAADGRSMNSMVRRLVAGYQEG